MSQSVLILEENQAVQGLIASTLWESQLKVYQKNQPSEVLSFAQEHQPDLIILASTTVGQTFKLAEQIRESLEFVQTPIIALLSSKDVLDAKQLQNSGINDYLRKPFEAASFQELVKKYIPSAFVLGPASLYQKAQSFEEETRPEEEPSIFDDEMMKALEFNEETEEQEDIPDVNFSDDLEEELDIFLEEEETFSDAEEKKITASSLVQSQISEEVEELGENDFEELDALEDSFEEEDELLLDEEEEEDELLLDEEEEEYLLDESEEEEFVLPEEEEAEFLTDPEKDEFQILNEDVSMDDLLEEKEMLEEDKDTLDEDKDALDELKKSGLEDKLVREQFQIDEEDDVVLEKENDKKHLNSSPQEEILLEIDTTDLEDLSDDQLLPEEELEIELLDLEEDEEDLNLVLQEDDQENVAEGELEVSLSNDLDDEEELQIFLSDEDDDSPELQADREEEEEMPVLTANTSTQEGVQPFRNDLIDIELTNTFEVELDLDQYNIEGAFTQTLNHNLADIALHTNDFEREVFSKIEKRKKLNLDQSTQTIDNSVPHNEEQIVYPKENVQDQILGLSAKEKEITFVHPQDALILNVEGDITELELDSAEEVLEFSSSEDPLVLGEEELKNSVQEAEEELSLAEEEEIFLDDENEHLAEEELFSIEEEEQEIQDDLSSLLEEEEELFANSAFEEEEENHSEIQESEENSQVEAITKEDVYEQELDSEEDLLRSSEEEEEPAVPDLNEADVEMSVLEMKEYDLPIEENEEESLELNEDDYSGMDIASFHDELDEPDSENNLYDLETGDNQTIAVLNLPQSQFTPPTGEQVTIQPNYPKSTQSNEISNQLGELLNTMVSDSVQKALENAIPKIVENVTKELKNRI